MNEAEFHHATCCGRRGAGLGLGRREPFAFPGTSKKYARDRVVDVKHVRLDVAVDPADRKIAGTATPHGRGDRRRLRPGRLRRRRARDRRGEGRRGQGARLRAPRRRAHRAALEAARRGRGGDDRRRLPRRAPPRPLLHRARRGLPGEARAGVDAGAGRGRPLLVPLLRLPEREGDERGRRHGAGEVHDAVERRARLEGRGRGEGDHDLALEDGDPARDATSSRWSSASSTRSTCPARTSRSTRSCRRAPRSRARSASAARARW